MQLFVPKFRCCLWSFFSTFGAWFACEARCC